MAHGCPTLQPIGTSHGNRYHAGLSDQDMQSKLTSFVTILREPTARIISSFCDGISLHPGLGQKMKDHVNKKFNEHVNWRNNETAIMLNFQFYTSQHYT